MSTTALPCLLLGTGSTLWVQHTSLDLSLLITRLPLLCLLCPLSSCDTSAQEFIGNPNVLWICFCFSRFVNSADSISSSLVICADKFIVNPNGQDWHMRKGTSCFCQFIDTIAKIWWCGGGKRIVAFGKHCESAAGITLLNAWILPIFNDNDDCKVFWVSLICWLSMITTIAKIDLMVTLRTLRL